MMAVHPEASVVVASDTGGMRQRLSAAPVAELAELLEDAPQRVGVVDEVLQAAAEWRGMTLVLGDPGCLPSGPVRARAARGQPDPDGESGRQQ
jgi:hypothetical protein